MKNVWLPFVTVVALFLNPVAVMAEYQAKKLTVDKVAVADNLVVVTLSGGKLGNQDFCASTASDHQAVVDLENNDHANYLYTHLMTAMVSEKTVDLALDGCVLVSNQESLPAIISAEVSK